MNAASQNLGRDSATPVTLLLSWDEYVMVLDALDKKIWSLSQSGTSGAYKRAPAFRKLRAEIAEIGAPSETIERDTRRDTDVA